MDILRADRSSFFDLDRLPDLTRHWNRNSCFVKPSSQTHGIDVYTGKLATSYGNGFRDRITTTIKERFPTGRIGLLAYLVLL